LRVLLDETAGRSTGGQSNDERGARVYQPPLATDERFAIGAGMAIFFVFLLGIGNFALHRAVLSSGHPLLAQLSWLIDGLGGRASLVLEFALLLAALLLVAGGHSGWTWVYLGYSVLNALAAWLILSRRM
jgi:hypothetical protein